MPIAFCEACYSWNHLENDGCAECGKVMYLTDLDPVLEEVNAHVGPIISPLGSLQINRSELPQRGFMWTTASGLLFVPYLIKDREHFVVPGQSESSWLSSALLSSAFRFFQHSSTNDSEADDGSFAEKPESPGSLLLTYPGAMFMAFSRIVRLTQRRQCWYCERIDAKVLTFKPRSSPTLFHERMHALVAQLPRHTEAREPHSAQVEAN